MPDVRRPGAAVLLRRRPRSARQVASARRGDPPLAPHGPDEHPLPQGAPRPHREAVQGEALDALREAAGEVQARPHARIQGRPRPSVAARGPSVRGSARVFEAPPRRGGGRRDAREVRGLPEFQDVSRLQRFAPPARVPRGDGRGEVDRRGDGDAGHRVARVLQEVCLYRGAIRQARRPQGHHRGDRAQAPVPARRRTRLPHPRPRRLDALRRGDAAHPPRDPDRLGAHRSPLCPRRADYRTPPTRQRAAHLDPQGAARPRQHRGRRGARRGDDARGGLHRRPRSRRWTRRREGDVPGRLQGTPQGQEPDGRLLDWKKESDDGRRSTADSRKSSVERDVGRRLPNVKVKRLPHRPSRRLSTRLSSARFCRSSTTRRPSPASTGRSPASRTSTRSWR